MKCHEEAITPLLIRAGAVMEVNTIDVEVQTLEGRSLRVKLDTPVLSGSSPTVAQLKAELANLEGIAAV
jgi:hypothetical protein